jgi:hypothetical protein
MYTAFDTDDIVWCAVPHADGDTADVHVHFRINARVIDSLSTFFGACVSEICEVSIYICAKST